MRKHFKLHFFNRMFIPAAALIFALPVFSCCPSAYVYAESNTLRSHASSVTELAESLKLALVDELGSSRSNSESNSSTARLSDSKNGNSSDDKSSVIYSSDDNDKKIFSFNADEYSPLNPETWIPQKYIMYSIDGRKLTIDYDEIEAYKNVGWYTEPLAEMSDDYGNTIYVIYSETDSYLQKDYHIKSYSDGLDELRSKLSSYMDGKSGEWGIYVKNLNTGACMILSDEASYRSASIIKLFVMAGVYNQIAAGNMQKDADTQELLTLMITESDNYSANRLVYKMGDGDYQLGFTRENDFTKSIGCLSTQHLSLFIGYGDFVAYGNNLVEPSDCGKLLEKIYRRELVSPEYSDEMLSLLKAQQNTSKIPQPLPEGTVTANKTGETSTVESDTAIVYSPACDYVICTLSNNSGDGAIFTIREISRMVYDYFNE